MIVNSEDVVRMENRAAVTDDVLRGMTVKYKTTMRLYRLHGY